MDEKDHFMQNWDINRQIWDIGTQSKKVIVEYFWCRTQ